MKIRNKVIIALVVLSLFLPLSKPVVEGLFPFSDDITGLKASTSADFCAISESDYATRWILQEASLTAVEDFHDDINTDYWNLVDASEDSFLAFLDESYLFDNVTTSDIFGYTGTHFDVGAQDGYPAGIIWDGSYFWVVGAVNKKSFKYSSAGVYTETSFDIGDEDGLPVGITWDGTYFWIVGDENDRVYKYNSAGVYQSVSFYVGDEDTYPQGITWDGTYFWIVGDENDRVYKYNSAGVYQSVSFYVGDEDTYPTGITWDGTHFWITTWVQDNAYKYTSAGVYTGTYFNIGSQDGIMRGITWDGTCLWTVGQSGDEVFEYQKYTDVYKNYFGSGYMYIQTDTTELISLKSINYTTHYNLSSGDYFEVDFQTSSDSEIFLILLQDGVVNKTLVLSPSGNGDFSRHTVQISVDEYVEFDQLKISSTFEDTDYLRVYDIKTYLYTIVGDYADFYISSHNQRDVNLTSGYYNLRVFDPYDGDAKVNTNITLGTADYYYIYEPIGLIDCRLSLYNPSDVQLEFTDYHIVINRSLNGVWNTFNLLDNIFTADVESHVYVNVSDRFDTLIDSFDKIASSYIDLELEVYSLQIKNLMEQRTTLDINTTYVYPLLSGDSIYFMLSIEYYEIGFYDNNNTYQQFTIYLNSNQAYELNRSKICFLSYADQQGNHLFFENYKTYINDSLIYENMFYREIGDNIGIEIKDRYDISIKNETYTVLSGDNYIPITLTLYSLKVMNQQEVFNWINITRDPNYYESSMYWSEWIAPTEIIEFKMFAGYYKINLTDNENSGSSFYEYTLSGDDILLISSGNIISNVIYNIANVNVTLGNQITNVEINITNQNSAINNTVLNIEINLDNINSTLGTMLVNLGLNITNIANNISTLYTFTNNSFINIDNTINTSFIYLENNIISFNQSISNLVIGVSNDIYLINGTISTMISSLENNLLLMNVSIDTALFGLNTTLNLIGSNITSNYILLNNSINLTNLNINDSRIAIINNLLLINNTISTMIADVYTAVYLINNSIYTAVVDLGTYLSLVNNTISGNLSIILEQNEFLTEIYQMTMFSELLNWTDIGLNISLLTSQIDVWTLINNYRNQSIEVHLRYQDLIEELIISADDLIEQWLPNEDVEYRQWSVDLQEYIGEWKPMPDNKTVDFGFYETEVPIIPRPLEADVITFVVFVVIIAVLSVVVIVAWAYMKKDRDKIPKKIQKIYTKPRKLKPGTYKGGEL